MIYISRNKKKLVKNRTLETIPDLFETEISARSKLNIL